MEKKDKTSKIPKDALEFTVNGRSFKLIATYEENNVTLCDIRDLNTNKVMRGREWVKLKPLIINKL